VHESNEAVTPITNYLTSSSCVAHCWVCRKLRTKPTRTSETSNHHLHAALLHSAAIFEVIWPYILLP